MRYVFALLLLIVTTVVTQAQTSMPFPSFQGYGIGDTQYPRGLFADGVHSDDAALKAAIDACSANNGKLQLPAGKILLTGAVGPINLRNCGIAGVLNPGGEPGTAGNGTTVLLTSTTVKPFIIGSHWSITGVNFYWPNQTNGTTAYPPLFSDTGSAGSGFWYLDHTTITNCYDGWQQTRGQGWGNFSVANSTIYCVHDVFQLNTIGDNTHVVGVQFTPGAWLQTTGFAPGTYVAIDAAAQINSVFHVTAGSGAQALVSNMTAFAWRWFLRLDANSQWDGGMIDGFMDAVGTIIDASASAANYTPQNVLTGNGGTCAIVSFTGVPPPNNNHPCFDMGATSYLRLTGYSAGSKGDVIRTAGSFVHARDSYLADGAALDGGDYAVVRVTAGAPEIIVQNNRMNGQPNDAHSHAIVSTAVAVPLLKIQNNDFIYFNDVIDVKTSPLTVVSGNTSQSTHGSVSVIFEDTVYGVLWNTNHFDKPPENQIVSCGGAGAAIDGTVAGMITIGDTNPTTSCSFSMPVILYGSAIGNCTFTGPAALIGATSSGTTWFLTFFHEGGTLDVHGQHVFYSCAGRQ